MRGVGSVARPLWLETQLPDLLAMWPHKLSFLFVPQFTPCSPPKMGMAVPRYGVARTIYKTMSRVFLYRKAGHERQLLASSSPLGEREGGFERFPWDRSCEESSLFCLAGSLAGS